jgi:hypothetical protein
MYYITGYEKPVEPLIQKNDEVLPNDIESVEDV